MVGMKRSPLVFMVSVVVLLVGQEGFVLVQSAVMRNASAYAYGHHCIFQYKEC